MSQEDKIFERYFTVAERLYNLEVRKDEIEEQIHDHRSELSTIKLGADDSRLFNFGEHGKISIRKSPLRFREDISQNNFQDIPSGELMSFIENDILEPIENIELNDDYIKGAGDEEVNRLIDLGVLRKHTRYKSKLRIESNEPTEFQKELVVKGALETAPNRIIVQRKPPGRKSKRGRPKSNF
jgi:hypothetical protein